MLRRALIGFLSTTLAFVREGRFQAFYVLGALALVAALVYNLGAYLGDADKRALRQQLAAAEQSAHQLSAELAQRNAEYAQLLTQSQLEQKIIESLEAEFSQLEASAIKKDELARSYQQILLGKLEKGGIIIYALDAEPVAGNDWRVGAVITRFDRKKTFKGGYYIEIIEQTADNQRIPRRLPEEGENPLEFVNHHEITELLELSDGSSVANLELVILDSKNNTVASEKLHDDSAAVPVGEKG